MTDLSAKFSAFRAQSADQTAAILAALADTNALLSDMITLLGGAPPAPTATLQDVVDVLQDIHLDTQSLDLKLLRIRDAIAPLDESFPIEAKSSILWSLYRIMDAINPTWPRPTSIPVQPLLHLLYAASAGWIPDVAAIRAALGTPTGDATTTALARLGAIQTAAANLVSATGMLAGGETTTVREYLAIIATNSYCMCGAPAADLTGCPDPYVSCGVVFVPSGIIIAGTNVHVAEWCLPLPESIEFGTTFLIGVDNTELVPVTDWEGFNFYVQSDAAVFAPAALTTQRLPCNQWFTVSGSDPLAFSVDSTYTLKVTICVPVPVEPEFECTREESIEFYSDVRACPWMTGIGSMAGHTKIWFGASATTGGIGTAELWIDGVLTLTIPNVPTDGADISATVSGTNFQLKCYGTDAMYMQLRYCPGY